MLKKILAILTAIGGVLSTVFFLLFKNEKTEKKNLEEKNIEYYKNLNALKESEKAEKKVKKENEKLQQKMYSNNNLDSFNASLELLQK